jgi:hypothetical protein
MGQIFNRLKTQGLRNKNPFLFWRLLPPPQAKIQHLDSEEELLVTFLGSASASTHLSQDRQAYKF